MSFQALLQGYWEKTASLIELKKNIILLLSEVLMDHRQLNKHLTEHH